VPFTRVSVPQVEVGRGFVVVEPPEEIETAPEPALSAPLRGGEGQGEVGPDRGSP
jgi:hypothetical protein